MENSLHIFVINLAHAADRLAFMRSQLGDRFERIEGVQGLDVPTFLKGQFGGSLTPGEIGCYASHLLAAKAILNRSLPYAVILEDDALVDADGWADIEQAVQRLDAWDVVALSGAKQHPNRQIACLNLRYLVRYGRFPKTTAAYVLSLSGAQKLLRARLRVRPVDVDIRYGWEMGIDGYGICPSIARQSGGLGSSIPRSGKQRFYWRSAPLRYLRGRAREIMLFLRTKPLKKTD